MADKTFPQGIAIAQDFCNREQERAELKRSISLHEHVVIVAPRRYGKTSLINKVLDEMDLPSSTIDFFIVMTPAEVEQQIEMLVSRIASKIVQQNKKTAKSLIENLKKFNPKLTLNLLGQKLEITSRQSPKTNISDLLLSLDNLASQTKQTCIVVMDEFQQIAELAESHTIEAAIRHAVERSQHISYIFCGSKRHMLNEMFSDKSRPLYHLCDLMTIDRIKSESYIPFLNQKATERWGCSLPDDVLNEIFTLTENHPYYINALCRQLWHFDGCPDLSLVQNEWERYVNKQSPWIIDDLDKLTLSRRKVLKALAQSPTKSFQGKTFVDLTGLTVSGIQKAFQYLLKQDQIYKSREDEYHIMDPAVAYFIRKIM